MHSATVLAYLHLVAGGKELVFRSGDHVIHRLAVSKNPPLVRQVEIEERERGKIALSWKAEHPEGLPLKYTIAYCDGIKRGLAIKHGLAKKSTVIDTRRLPGGNKCHFGVLATDGVRSAFAFSNAVKIDEKKPQVSIVSPIEGTNFPPDQAISIRGQATDVLGARTDAKNLIWQIDGSITDRGSFSTTANSLEPGRHKIALEYRKGVTILATASVTVTVVGRNQQQTKFHNLLKKFDARVDGGA